MFGAHRRGPVRIHHLARHGDPYAHGTVDQEGVVDVPHSVPLALATDAVPVLMYHDIRPDAHGLWTLTPEQFMAEMAFLHHCGFHTLTPQELEAAMSGDAALPPRPILLTFDDGYESFYQDAYPVLRRYGMHATVFVITGFVGRPGYLTRAQLQTLASAGWVTLESHTVDHPRLAHLSPERVNWEVRQSRSDLDLWSNQPVMAFAYPYGDYNRFTVQAVAAAGYQLAFTTHPGYAPLNGDPLQLPRLEVSGGITMRQFEEMLAPSWAGSSG